MVASDNGSVQVKNDGIPFLSQFFYSFPPKTCSLQFPLLEFLHHQKIPSVIQSIIQTGFTHKRKLFPAAEQEVGTVEGGVFLGAVAESLKLQEKVENY